MSGMAAQAARFCSLLAKGGPGQTLRTIGPKHVGKERKRLNHRHASFLPWPHGLLMLMGRLASANGRTDFALGGPIRIALVGVLGFPTSGENKQEGM